MNTRNRASEHPFIHLSFNNYGQWLAETWKDKLFGADRWGLVTFISKTATMQWLYFYFQNISGFLEIPSNYTWRPNMIAYSMHSTCTCTCHFGPSAGKSWLGDLANTSVELDAGPLHHVWEAKRIGQDSPRISCKSAICLGRVILRALSHRLQEMYCICTSLYYAVNEHAYTSSLFSAFSTED